MSQMHVQNLSFLILPHDNICSSSRLWHLKKSTLLTAQSLRAILDPLSPVSSHSPSISVSCQLSLQSTSGIWLLQLSSTRAMALKAAVLCLLEYGCHLLTEPPALSLGSPCRLVLTLALEWRCHILRQIRYILAWTLQGLPIWCRMKSNILKLPIRP